MRHGSGGHTRRLTALLGTGLLAHNLLQQRVANGVAQHVLQLSLLHARCGPTLRNVLAQGVEGAQGVAVNGATRHQSRQGLLQQRKRVSHHRN